MWPSALDLFLIQLSHPQALGPSGVVEGTTVAKVAMGMVHFKDLKSKTPRPNQHRVLLEVGWVMAQLKARGTVLRQVGQLYN